MGNHGAAGARARAGTTNNRTSRSTDVNSRSSLLNLSDWPVSRRLFAVIVMALVMGLVFGGLRLASAESSAGQFGRVAKLASLGQRLAVLVQDLQNERDATLGLLAGSGNQNTLTPLYAQTDGAVAAVQPAVAGIGGDFPVNIQNDATTAAADISGSRIADLHSTLKSPQDNLAVIANYGAIINNMISLADQVGQGVSDASLSSDVRAFNALALAKEQTSRQRALLNYSFGAGDLNTSVQVDPNSELALQIASQQELADEATFQATATPAEQVFLTDSLGAGGAAPSVAHADELESLIFSNEGQNGSPLLGSVQQLGVPGVVAFNTLRQGQQAWDTGMADKLNAIQADEMLIADNIASRAQQLQSDAQQNALITAIVTGVVLLLVLLAALLVARSLVLPLRRLRAGALDVASVQLPERVKQLSESPDLAASLEVAPIDVLSADEIGQVARAFDQVHQEAVRLAGEEAVLRTSFNAMFVNLSRRTQSLVERLARMIDSLEQNEDDPDRLSNLFSMDHLVTRMRRNSENLLLLAGHEGARKWSEPVSLADVARAATSEIEQYSRVVLNVQPGVAVIGQAVSDVVHLLAEIIENATMFSPKDTQVLVSAQELTSGGVLIEVTDKGIGVSETRLAEMNWRLDNPPVMDVSVSRHMGLFAVARLAERHQVRVRLRSATPQGLTALVWLPESVIERTGRGFTGTGGWTQQTPVQGGFSARRASGQHNIVQGPGRHSIGTRSAALDSPPAADRSVQVALPSRTAQASASPGGMSPGGAAPAASQPTSSWFRGRHSSETGGANGGAAARTPAGGAGNGSGDTWSGGRNPADIVADPVRGEQTSAGLPMRVPQANLIPGSATGGRQGAGSGQPPSRSGSSQEAQTLAAPLPQRSPDMARSRLSGFQRGARRAEGQTPRAGEGADR